MHGYSLTHQNQKGPPEPGEPGQHDFQAATLESHFLSHPFIHRALIEGKSGIEH